MVTFLGLSFEVGLNTLLVPRVWKLYFFFLKVWKVTKLVLVVLKSDQVSSSVS
jgi:hypothetical protein